MPALDSFDCFGVSSERKWLYKITSSDWVETSISISGVNFVTLHYGIGHETGGHDILHAYSGMLDEIGSKVAAKLLEVENDPALKGYAVVNGRQQTVARFAAKYWKEKINETASDVCGLLNIGPAAGISLAALLINLPCRGGKL